jgi:hypothetical protein
VVSLIEFLPKSDIIIQAINIRGCQSSFLEHFFLYLAIYSENFILNIHVPILCVVHAETCQKIDLRVSEPHSIHSDDAPNWLHVIICLHCSRPPNTFRPVMGQSAITSILSKYGYSSWSEFSNHARLPTITQRNS